MQALDVLKKNINLGQKEYGVEENIGFDDEEVQLAFKYLLMAMEEYADIKTEQLKNDKIELENLVQKGVECTDHIKEVCDGYEMENYALTKQLSEANAKLNDAGMILCNLRDERPNIKTSQLNEVISILK